MLAEGQAHTSLRVETSRPSAMPLSWADPEQSERIDWVPRSVATKRDRRPRPAGAASWSSLSDLEGAGRDILRAGFLN